MRQNPVTNEKGAAAVEFAIVLPLLLLLIFGIIEFSAVFYNQAVITNASREGARAGIVYRWSEDSTGVTAGEIQEVVITYLENRLLNFGGDPENFQIGVTGAQGVTGSPLQVDVEYRYDFLVIHAFARALGMGLDLSARTIMRIE